MHVHGRETMNTGMKLFSEISILRQGVFVCIKKKKQDG